MPVRLQFLSISSKLNITLTQFTPLNPLTAIFVNIVTEAERKSSSLIKLK